MDKQEGTTSEKGNLGNYWTTIKFKRQTITFPTEYIRRSRLQTKQRILTQKRTENPMEHKKQLSVCTV